MTRWFAPRVFWPLLLATFVFARDVTIRGFVTSVNSPTSFAIDDYKVTRDKTVPLVLEKQQGDNFRATFKPEDILVGTELEIQGEYDEASGELKAKSIKVFSYDTLDIKRTALLEKLPSLTQTDSGWSGVIYADGQRITVSPTTAVSLKPNHEERKRAATDKNAPAQRIPDSLNLDTFVHYEGVRQSNGSIQAQKVEFEHAEIEDGDARMWRRFTPKVTEPDYAGLQPGELRMQWKTYRIIPKREAQDYIIRLGNSLIPAHQKDLPDGDPLKIRFQFFLVEDKLFNAATYPNGVVIVHSGVFDLLQNESQLAFVLSHEISHAIERHAWQQGEYYRNQLIALRARGVSVPGSLLEGNLRASGFSSQYARSLENQADRVGLELMLAAGYDIREAPQSWKAVSEKMGDPTTNPFWASHENYTARRSYLMAELRNNYSHVDYSKLKKDSEEFRQVANAIKKLEDGKNQKAKQSAKADPVVPTH
jgi:Peptidase family M48/Domain of unknown function (DUF5666)